MNLHPSTSNRVRPLVSGLLIAWFAGATVAVAHTLTQTFVLQPGWNAIWLEVDPPDRSPDLVFAGAPVASVWTWSERVSATDFIQNPSDPQWNRNQWLAWFPSDSPEALLANLQAVLPGRAYLVRSQATNAVSFQITGRVGLRTTAWSPHQYNLRGLPADSEAPPTFREFFRHSTGHWDPARNEITPVYRLDPLGHWDEVSPDELVERGRAYWIYARSVSEYAAPFHLESRTGEGMRYPALAHRATLTVQNLTAEPRTLVFRSLNADSRAVHVEEAVGPGLPNERTKLHGHQRVVAGGGAQQIRLFLDRTQLRELTPPGSGGRALQAVEDRYEEVFAASDQQGTLHYLGIQAEGVNGAPDPDDPHALAGLWIGTAQVNAVGEAHATNAAPPTPVLTPFPLRLLVHVDTNGAAHLLREVTLVSLPAVYTNSFSTNTNATAVLAVPARTVLLSDAELRSRYHARFRQVNNLTVRRLSAVQFDDAENPSGVPLVGTFSTGGVLRANLSIPSGHSSNPYYHRYHPDHDNLDPTYQHPVVEDIPVARTVEMDFTPVGTGVPDYGVNGFDGTYRETVTGLHKVPLRASGTFTLQRISLVGELNPPLPELP